MRNLRPRVPLTQNIIGERTRVPFARVSTVVVILTHASVTATAQTVPPTHYAPPQLVFVNVNAPSGESQFLRELVREAFYIRGFESVACSDDIKAEIAWIDIFEQRHINKDSAPDRVALLQKITKAGCKTDADRQLWGASLTAHVDRGVRTVSLTLIELAAGRMAMLASASEAADGKQDWGRLVNAVVAKVLQEEAPVTVAMDAEAHALRGEKVRLRAKKMHSAALDAPSGVDVVWTLYQCNASDACVRFRAARVEEERCNLARINLQLTWQRVGLPFGSVSECPRAEWMFRASVHQLAEDFWPRRYDAMDASISAVANATAESFELDRDGHGIRFENTGDYLVTAKIGDNAFGTELIHIGRPQNLVGASMGTTIPFAGPQVSVFYHRSILAASWFDFAIGADVDVAGTDGRANMQFAGATLIQRSCVQPLSACAVVEIAIGATEPPSMTPRVGMGGVFSVVSDAPLLPFDLGVRFAAIRPFVGGGDGHVHGNVGIVALARF